ncbi:type II toxin-antitoxin system Phd/YefM family antitoxin [Synechococcus sp. PCC 6312]|uniref:type II toxin-antitoxin system Phd/YefM family antitoxin n=1 Tax=Synechococcus sp. (strain ATCC 27167 / PCC 6312) TaxID=195253 RepID=UPI00029F023F|nr:type II toxin-antitoxin system Phd/YefM family antitoxin [Synechococcus sp. PCC 6312]AFY60125.1 antitoxin of toxin-antitoxin stability system [Synechococcus sp. PCC 6312]
MSNLSLVDAQTNLPELIDQIAQSQETLVISGEIGNAVLISADYWQAIQETIYLLSIPQLGQSIQDGLLTPVSECSQTLEW